MRSAVMALAIICGAMRNAGIRSRALRESALRIVVLSTGGCYPQPVDIYSAHSVRNLFHTKQGHRKEQTMAYTAQHIANYFIERAESDGVQLEPLKLIKLVYIAYGWVLALTKKRLFEEPIEAWKHGPVVPSLYHEFKHFRYSHISERAANWDMDSGMFVTPEIPHSDTTTRMILEKVWAAYSQFTAWALRNKTHEPETPWTLTFDGSMGKVIRDDLIAPHFRQKIREIVDAARSA